MLTVADLIADLNDFNGHAYNRFVEKIKVSSSFVFVFHIPSEGTRLADNGWVGRG